MPSSTTCHSGPPTTASRPSSTTSRPRGRIEIAGKIEVARELGDLSENGDYHAAKEEQGKMEARIRQLEAMLLDAVIVEDDGTGAVQPGCIVTIRVRRRPDDDVERYLVGSIEERDEGLDVISPGSPLGEALIGAVQGDSVTYEAPNGASLEGHACWRSER